MSPEWDGALDEFRDQLAEAGRRPGTWRTHAAYLRRFSAESAKDGPWAVDPAQLVAWLDGRSWGPDTCLSAVAALRSFYGWGYRSGLSSSNPALTAFPAGRGGPGARGDQDLPPAWVELVEGWTRFLAGAGRRPQTIRLQRIHVGAFARAYPDPRTVREAHCLAYLGSQQWAPETRKSARTALRGFFSWAVSRGGIEHDPAAQLPTVRVPAGVPHPAPTDVLDGALAAADDKARLMLLLAAYAGLRRAEIAQVHPARDIADGALNVVGKGGRGRLVPLHPLLLAEITAELDRRQAGGVGTGFRYRNAAAADGYLFPGQSPGSCTTPDAVGAAVSPLLGEHYTTHGLRHRFATRAYAGTRDIRAVQELLGHSKPETTMRYTAIPDGAKLAAVLAI